MRLEEAPRVLYDLVDVLLRIFPGIDGHLGVRGEAKPRLPSRRRQIEDWVILPDGPWVKPFSTLYTLRHFSCGPPCYSNMKIWAGNEQLYISVWGDAIDTAVEGVYRLDARREGWEKIIAGALDNGLICDKGINQGSKI